MELWIKDYQMTTFVDELYQLSLLVLEIWLVEKDLAVAAVSSRRTIFALEIFALCWKYCAGYLLKAETIQLPTICYRIGYRLR